jgi:hypothetical protein
LNSDSDRGKAVDVPGSIEEAVSGIHDRNHRYEPPRRFDSVLGPPINRIGL